MMNQDYNKNVVSLQELMDRATTIDAKLQAREQERKSSGKQVATPEVRKATTRGTQGVTTSPAGHKFVKGEKFYMMGTDGRAKKEEVESIGRNVRGVVVPTIKW